ncbi:MAG: Gldg family protein [Nitrococcus sp.]|nr:Gldg family protein [Nitrococcus sp.]
MPDVLRVARKEMAAFFGSPVAYIFLAAFLAVTLFVFFWVETFFARNLADVRPLFKWMPILLIFLVAAVTMRMWSEERRSGTLELLMTLPVSPLRLVLGKFLACIGLIAVALLLTLPLTITVAILGPLDWGPVIGGYLATLLLAAAYTAIGLYISCRTDNQIVSLIGTVLICTLFYLIGSNTLTDLFGQQVSGIMALLGTGSRFESITRGVLDLRDLYYYVSLAGVFLTLNVYALERLRWAGAGPVGHGHRQWRIAAVLFIANFVVANFWLQPIGWARADITEGQVYSISPATRLYLSHLQEPLLIRGYFSAKTHPLLAPLVPQLKNLLKEYAVVGGERVRVSFVDPQQNPELEREANKNYGIRPVPFRIESKYQASVVNSYFHVLVKYGDQYGTLNFRDLTEIKSGPDRELRVELHNPEYQITRTIKKVLYAYRGGGNVFSHITEPVTFQGFISSDSLLPADLVKLREDLAAILDELATQANGKLKVQIRNPRADGAALARKIQKKYGFQPMVTSLLDPTQFYFYMLLRRGDQSVPVPLPQSLDKADLKRNIEAALKRFATGLLKTIALYTPSPESGYYAQGIAQFQALETTLRENAAVRKTDLSSGRVPTGTDLLLVVSPWELDEKQLFAIDQFLMRGGTVAIAASPFDVNLGGGGLTAKKRATGLEKWLAAKGIDIADTMVLDPRNIALPIPVERTVGGIRVREIRSLDYPYLIDIRQHGMLAESPITAGLERVAMTWASPLQIAAQANKDRKVSRVLQSSPRAWTSDSQTIEPNFRRYPRTGFAIPEDRGRKLLAAVVQGRFQSYFKDKPSPLLERKSTGEDKKKEEKASAADEDAPTTIGAVIERSPASARLILFGSNSFLSDTALDLIANATRTQYMSSVQLVQNAIEWSLEGPGLLAIRGRSHYSRLLEPLSQDAQRFWEYLNYAAALCGLAIVFGVQRLAWRRRERYYLDVLKQGGHAA